MHLHHGHRRPLSLPKHGTLETQPHCPDLVRRPGVEVQTPSYRIYQIGERGPGRLPTGWLAVLAVPRTNRRRLGSFFLSSASSQHPHLCTLNLWRIQARLRDGRRGREGPGPGWLPLDATRYGGPREPPC